MWAPDLSYGPIGGVGDNRRMRHLVTLLVREGCGSCVRVHGEIAPLCAEAGAELEVVDVEAPEAAVADRLGPASELRAEFGDRLPVVLVDGHEHSCWEVDPEELATDLASAEPWAGE